MVMERLKQLVKEANSEFMKANHLAYVTYPMIKETKLLYVIAEVLQGALAKGVEAMLHYERLYKRIPLVPGAFDTELELFKNNCIVRYGFNRNVVLLLLDLKSLVRAKKESPVEFSRQGQLVICDEDYGMNVIDIQKLKSYVMDSREFIERMNHVLKGTIR